VIFKRESKDLPAGLTSLITLPARTMLVAAGTTPNIMYEKECAGTFQLDAKKKFFQPHEATRNGDGRFHLAADKNGFFTSYDSNGKFVTYYGDNHPRYASEYAALAAHIIANPMLNGEVVRLDGAMRMAPR